MPCARKFVFTFVNVHSHRPSAGQVSRRKSPTSACSANAFGMGNTVPVLEGKGKPRRSQANGVRRRRSLNADDFHDGVNGLGNLVLSVRLSQRPCTKEP
jgi:hypothetical protein